ncbi:MAG: pitrilysin family protein, partial [Akkermansiaceae bacterium]|nr:pitrilysin family protein [Akkermansiaceae bacterium]
MQKVTSAVLVLILLLCALYFSIQSQFKQSTEPEASEATTAGKSEIQVPPAKPEIDRPWAHQLSDIPADPKAHFGRLENGMRYIIYPNEEPPKRVSLRLHIEAGSLMEDDDQRGIAHFLEHMMFNGTENYDADELIPEMQRLGIAFGAHANAYTSFDETVYMLDLPDLKEETVDLTFNVMRDFCDGALLTKEEIDKERGVIIAEKVSRDDVRTRLMKQQFQQLMPDSKISHRFPIGLEKVIKNAPRERFVDFYESYYIPQRMTFVVVGDVDVASMEKRIIDTFGSLTNPEEPGEDAELGRISPPESLQAAIFQDPEVDETDVSLLLARTHEPKPDSRENRIELLKLQVANAIIGRRFERISKEKDSPVSSGYSYKSTWFQAVDFGSIGVTAADDRWQDVVPIVENEFRRVMEHGFLPSELEEVKSNLINAAKQAVERKPSRKSDSLATGIAGSLNDMTVFTTPETDLAIIEEA